MSDLVGKPVDRFSRVEAHMATLYATCDDDFANVCVLFSIWSMNGRSIGLTTIHSQIISSIAAVYL